MVLNNLALVYSEKRDAARALSMIEEAFRQAPDNDTIYENFKWIWHRFAHGGMLKPAQFAGVALIVDNDASAANLKIQLCRLFDDFIAQAEEIEIWIKNSDGDVVARFRRPLIWGEKSYLMAFEKIDLTKLPDGRYRIGAKLLSDDRVQQIPDTPLDIICHQYQSFVEKWERLHQGLKKLRSGFSAKHFQNSAANLEVMLLKIKQQLDDCKSWESFQFYSENIEQDLASASAALQELENGKNPFEHQTGTFMRGYYSEIDGSLQGYALHVPDTYRGETSFPLVLNLHGFDPSYSPWWENIFLSVFMPHATAHQRYILVNPFGRGNTIYQNIGEHDVLQVFAEVKRLYHIDENRIYLTGGSMGGAGVWNIGLKYPDLFAALAPIMGPTEFNFWIGAPTEKLPSFRSFLYQKRSALSFAENALQLPVLCHHGVMDDIVPIEQSRKMVSRFHELGYAIRYVEHPQAAHGGFEPEMEQSIYDWFQDHEKNPNPSRVKVKAGALDQAKAYWIEIEKFIKLNEFAIVDAEITAQNSFDIKTENVARFRLFLNDYLVDGQQPLLFRIDGETYDDFQLPSDKKVFCSSVLDSNGLVSGWKINPPPQKQFRKKRGLAGPILDVFNHSFLIVYGASGTTEENQVNFDEAMRFVEQ
ncbi:MAG: prolyl oligopeptidase family serine peptidase, partial [bacterium]|nr:prolyl oligopeptidase family serine peptidase [bacterium]